MQTPNSCILNHMLSKMCQKNYSQQNQHAPAFLELMQCQNHQQHDPWCLF